MIKLLEKIARWADARIERASTCPACQHNADTSVPDSNACNCTRLDCACSLYHDGLTPCGQDDCPILSGAEWCSACNDVENGRGFEPR